ncbi:MAG: MalY/PatB family protein [Christensenellales bacterium]
MNYDFESFYDRTLTKASKWVMMHRQNPDVRPGIVPMTTADMDFMTAPEITDALLRYIPGNLLGYSRPTDRYLDSIVGHYGRVHGYQARREWLFTLPGVVPALAAAVRACTLPGEGIIVLTPIYGPFYEVIRGQGRQVVACPMDVRDRRYQIDFERFEGLCAHQRPRLFLLCSPHNPSGRVWTRGELLALSDICEKYGVQMVSDEIHCDIILGDLPHTVLNTLSPWAQSAILCTSAGKTYNIQALQCANVFIRNEALRARYEEVNLHAGIERANVLGMVATAAAYERAGEWLEALSAVIRRNHGILLDFFARYPSQFMAFLPDASFLGWVDCRGLGLTREALLRFLVSCDFFVTEGAPFGEAAASCIRINVGLPTRALQENLARLQEGLRAQLGIIGQ